MADEKIDSEEVTGLCHTRGIDLMDITHLYYGECRHERTDVVSWPLQESGTARWVRINGVAQRLTIVYPSDVGMKGRMEHQSGCSAR